MKIELGEINIITGERDVGKTTLCSKLVEKLKYLGYSVAGIISPGIYRDDVKIGIRALDIKNGRKVKLADFSPGWDKENPSRMWKMNAVATPWGNHVLKKSVPCDILIIDEIGYLELEINGGWKKSFEILEGKLFKIAFIVIRKELVEVALSHWENAQVLILESAEDMDSISKEILHQIELKAPR
jgi:nucleoside-triphosphatase THEP1